MACSAPLFAFAAGVTFLAASLAIAASVRSFAAVAQQSVTTDRAVTAKEGCKNNQEHSTNLTSDL